MKYLIILLLFITSALHAQKKPVKRAVVVRTAAKVPTIVNIQDIPGLTQALASKQEKITNGNNKQVMLGDGSLINAAFSSFSDDVGFFKKYFQFSTQTSSFTLSIPDDSKFINVLSTTPVTVTIPSNDTAAFKIGTQITISNLGTGTVTFAAKPGVTILTTKNTIALVDINSVATLIKKADNIWQIIGQLQ